MTLSKSRKNKVHLTTKNNHNGKRVYFSKLHRSIERSIEYGRIIRVLDRT